MAKDLKIYSIYRTQGFGVFYPERYPKAHPMGGTSIQILNCSNPCKKIQIEFHQTQKLGVMLLQIVSLWSSRSSLFAKWTINLVLLHFFSKPAGYPLVTGTRVQPPISKLIFQTLTHVVWTGPVYILADNWSKHNFSYNHSEFLLWCPCTIPSHMLQCLQFHLNLIQLW